MTEKTLLVVGAALGQIPAIITAKKMGLNVVVVDKNADAKGMELADYAYAVDCIDKEGVLAVAKKHQINGIFTMQTDISVPTVGYVNDIMGLAGISFKAADICSNKRKIREELERFGCKQPKFSYVNNIDEALKAIEKVGMPCIVKAIDSSGSRGVRKVGNAEEIAASFVNALRYSNSKGVLIEEFVDGIEFGAQAFSVKGNCETVIFHNDTISDAPYMVPTGHSFPLKDFLKRGIKDIEKDVKDAVNVLGIDGAIANVDLIYDIDNNKINIIEIGARMGATCLPELLQYHTGIDWVEKGILLALGEDISIEINKNQLKPVAARVLCSPSDGIFKGYSFDKKKHDLLEFEITAEENDVVSELKKGTDRIGKIICFGKSVEEAEKKLIEAEKDIEYFIAESGKAEKVENINNVR